MAWERTLPLGPGATVTVQVAAGPEEQRVLVSTNRPGRLLLHWGVEGGRGYKGGWRLPGDSCRPEGTNNYKNRALQTPFRPANGNGGSLQVRTGRCKQWLVACWRAAAAHACAGGRGGKGAACSFRCHSRLCCRCHLLAKT